MILIPFLGAGRRVTVYLSLISVMVGEKEGAF